MIAPAIDVELYRPRDMDDQRYLLGLPQHALILLWHGSLSGDDADLMPLLIAFRSVIDSDPGEDLYLAIVGSGAPHMWAALEEASRVLGIDSKVRLHRQSAFTKVQQWYSAADVYVSTQSGTRDDGYLGIIRAMASGVPQVATDWGGIRDAVSEGETGFLCPTFWADWPDEQSPQHTASATSPTQQLKGKGCGAYEVAALAGKLTNIIRNAELRASMRIASRERAVARFSLTVAAHEYANLWAELWARYKSSHGLAIASAAESRSFSIYEHIASQRLTDATVIRKVAEGEAEQEPEAQTAAGEGESILDSITRALATNPRGLTVGEVQSHSSKNGTSIEKTYRALLKALQYGLIEVA
jgi:hypothetical protein